jgi:antirestriction protein
MGKMKELYMDRLEELSRDLLREFGKDETKVDAYITYLENMHQPLDDLWRNYVEEFEDSYIGKFDSRADFVESIIELQLGLTTLNSVNDNGIQLLITYFDKESYGRDLFISGEYWSSDDFYYRSY